MERGSTGSSPLRTSRGTRYSGSNSPAGRISSGSTAGIARRPPRLLLLLLPAGEPSAGASELPLPPMPASCCSSSATSASGAWLPASTDTPFTDSTALLYTPAWKLAAKLAAVMGAATDIGARGEGQQRGEGAHQLCHPTGQFECLHARHPRHAAAQPYSTQPIPTHLSSRRAPAAAWQSSAAPHHCWGL